MRNFDKRSFARTRKANFAIEFALIAPVLFFMILACMELGWQSMTDAALRYGARMGARFGQTGSCTLPTGMSTSTSSRLAYINTIVIQSTGSFLQATRLTTTIYSFSSYEDYLNGTAPETGGGSGGETVEYSFSYAQPYLSSLTATVMGKAAFTHTVNLVVQNEPFQTTCS